MQLPFHTKMKLFVQEKDHSKHAIQMFIVLSNMNDTHKNAAIL